MALIERAVLEVLVDIAKGAASMDELTERVKARLAEMNAAAANVEVAPTAEAASAATQRSEELAAAGTKATSSVVIFGDAAKDASADVIDLAGGLDRTGTSATDAASGLDKTADSSHSLQGEFADLFKRLDDAGKRIEKLQDEHAGLQEKQGATGEGAAALGTKLAIGGAAVFAAQAAFRSMTAEVVAFGKELGLSEESLSRFQNQMDDITSPTAPLRIFSGLLQENVSNFRSWQAAKEGDEQALRLYEERLESTTGFFRALTFGIVDNIEAELRLARVRQEAAGRQQDFGERVDALREKLEMGRKELGLQGAALLQLSNDYVRAGTLTADMERQLSQQAADLLEQMKGRGLAVEDAVAKMAQLAIAEQEAKKSTTELKEAGEELLPSWEDLTEELGTGTEVAAAKGKVALGEYRDEVKAVAADVATAAEDLARGLRQEERGQEEPTGDGGKAAQDTQRRAEALRDEIAELEQQNDEFIISEKGIQDLATARDQLGKLEKQLAAERTFASEEYERQLQQQNEGLEQQSDHVARAQSLTDSALQSVLNFENTFGEAGRVASGELNAIVQGWIDQQAMIGVTADDVDRFSSDFAAAMSRARQHAKQYGEQSSAAHEEASTAAQANAEDLADLDAQHDELHKAVDELAGSTGELTTSFDEEGKALEKVGEDATKAKKGLDELGAQDLAPVLEQSKMIRAEWAGINVELQSAKTCIAQIAGQVPA